MWDLKKPAFGCGLAQGTLLCLAPLVIFCGSLGVGAYHTSPLELVSVILCQHGAGGIAHVINPGMSTPSPEAVMGAHIVSHVRLPRLIAALLVGGALSCSGAVFQALFMNPLASPYTLGVSNGAGFGAAIGILAGVSSVVVQVSALIWGLAAVGATLLLARYGGRGRSTTLVLTGVLVGSLFASFVSLIKFMADPTEKLPAITYWLMGSLSGVSYESLLGVAPLYVISMIGLFCLRWRLNVLSMGDIAALSYGVNVTRDKTVLIFCASILTALSVSLAGVIGWVGIVVPHIARLVGGPDLRKLLPTSLSLGMCYLMVIDNLCRTLSAAEIPLGVITGIIGAPIFAWVIVTKKMTW